MNLEGQNLESLRRMVRHLQEENQELKELLKNIILHLMNQKKK